MISWEEIKDYLPTFLSQGSQNAFLDDLRHFLGSGEKPFYSGALEHETIVFQGDGLEGLLVVNLPDTTVDRAPAMVLSNSCDVATTNERMFDASLTYAPIFPLDRYLEVLRQRYSEERVRDHERDIRRQAITQIFFLPQGGKLKGDCLVFLDRISSAANTIVERDRLKDIRLFTLSDFGAWLFALKLSIHFCRIRDNVDRMAGAVQ